MIIADAQERITKNLVLLQQREAPLKEAEEMYNIVKSEYDVIQNRLTFNKLILESVSRFKNGIPQTKGFRVLRGNCHNEMKPKEKRKYRTFKFSWTTWDAEVLKEQTKFLLADDLSQIIVEKYAVQKKLEQADKPKSEL